MRTIVLVLAACSWACATPVNGQAARQARRPAGSRVLAPPSGGDGEWLTVAAAGGPAPRCRLKRRDVEAIRDAIMEGIDSAVKVFLSEQKYPRYRDLEQAWFFRDDEVRSAIERRLHGVEVEP